MEVRGASESAHAALADFLWRPNPRAASVPPDEELGPLSLWRLNKSFLYNSATSLLGTSPLEMCPVAIGRHALECSQQDYSSWLKTGDYQKPLLEDCKKAATILCSPSHQEAEYSSSFEYGPVL